MATAYVLINCDLGSEEFIISELKEIETVTEVWGVLGTYDIIVKLESGSLDEISKTITLKIRKFDKIRYTMTLNTIEGQTKRD